MVFIKQIAACLIIAAIAIGINQIDNNKVKSCLVKAQSIVMEDYSYEEIKTMGVTTVETIAGLKQKAEAAIAYTQDTLDSYRELED
ncbi:hypothetical protein [Clostridium aminobutyricum]|uniref:Uncharacterized protein n=1 Tax=Clostridium aminobutyricum TaxID=33953 RepID=A0A939D7K3_CLOAM|nr:hypothetical protein [Clostridium aminobutyricum]MBN7772552.1 hypothetical protein [Clostridium aminobutyricum]